LNGAIGGHDGHLDAGIPKTLNILYVSLKLFLLVPILEKTHLARQITDAISTGNGFSSKPNTEAVAAGRFSLIQIEFPDLFDPPGTEVFRERLLLGRHGKVPLAHLHLHAVPFALHRHVAKRAVELGV
jgi:hypothetical protein